MTQCTGYTSAIKFSFEFDISRHMEINKSIFDIMLSDTCKAVVT